MTSGSLTQSPSLLLTQDCCQLSQVEEPTFICPHVMGHMASIQSGAPLGRDLIPFSEFPPRTGDIWGPLQRPL